MTQKRRTLLAVILVLVALLLAGAVTAALLLRTNSSTSSQMERGQKYLASGDYTNAVLCYQRAIDSDPALVDAYIGLAQTYLSQGKNIMAKSVLTRGFDLTGSTRIQLMLQSEFGDEQGAATEPEPTATATEATEKQGDGRFNYNLLQTIAKNTYDDYRRTGSISSEGAEGDGYVVHTTGAEALFGSGSANEPAIDGNTGKPYTTRRPSTVTLNDITDLFGGRAQITLKELRGIALDNIKVVEDAAHGWVVTFGYAGCTAEIACDEDGTIHSGAWNEFTPPQGDAQGNSALTGSVVDATTGGGVSDVELKIRTGSQQTGSPLATTKTSGSGEYGFDVGEGDYTIEVNKNGYTTEFFPVHVNQGSTEPQNLTISPLLQEGEIRIVLEWGADPTDLDSYLTGRTDSGSEVSVNYHNRESSAGGNTLAQLDVDDRNGYGPETTTVYDVNGVYSFYVVDYLATGRISQSGATVKVYTPNQSAPIIINVCGGLNNRWNVCVIDHGEVQVINGG